MVLRDGRVDAYIAESAEFAQPILKHLRQLVHTACPEVEETIKWRFASFTHKGLLCSMAAFKQHCTFGFWKHALLVELNATQQKKTEEAMGQLGRITAVADLPADKIILGYIKEAVRLNEQGIKVPRAHKPHRPKVLVVPPEFAAALKRSKPAAKAFTGLSPSHKREYVEWITEAKREETRAKRIATSLAWLAEGKPRNWKYAKCQ